MFVQCDQCQRKRFCSLRQAALEDSCLLKSIGCSTALPSVPQPEITLNAVAAHFVCLGDRKLIASLGVQAQAIGELGGYAAGKL